MLSDRDRTLLAPYLALLRAAQRELAAARRSFDEAERQLSESTVASDWRDRALGGLFSADDGRTRRFRQARDAQKAAAKTLAAAQARHTERAERLNELFEPMLAAGDDPAYAAAMSAVRVCDKALKACQGMRHRIASALKNPTTNTKDSETWYEAEFARQRFDELIDELRTSVPQALGLVERAGAAVGETEPIGLSAPFCRSSGKAAEQELRSLQRQLETTVKKLERWRVRAGAARTEALRAAHDRL